ncbi:cytochrome P450 [Mycolicibacterium chitae]|uniref:Steroid C26-monooxygenase n=1 Tax=Mycolicibacterium chitae TaxID=1792 RepID=A0A448IA20_MYCCI|nr:cytochrome P450 [Mycolicibacterium chitae]MCV7105090.1 cytochrome P450 [Mycolicibacterium chitae]BBZ05629.1 cytochrome P450 [Mycolicibacterium chitae]VEG49241.1 cytochrome P450 [Mycolicibacterium chitae]
MTATTTDIPERLRVDFDIFDPALTSPADRFQEEIAKLAGIGPVVYSSAYGGHWIVTGYEEIQQILRDADLFSSYPNDIRPNDQGKIVPLELDPPEHTAFRQAMQPLFSPRRMKALETIIRETTGELLDGFAMRGSAEFVAEFAHELPTRMFLGLMDLPLRDAPLFTEASDTFLQGKPELGEEASRQATIDAMMQMHGYFAGVVEERRNRPEPGSDVTSQIIHTPIELQGERRLLTDAELSNMFFLLLLGGLHTVQGSLAWGLLYLANNPEQRQKLIDNPGLAPAAVEEILRIEAAVSMGRSARRDTVIAGVPIKAGDQLLLSLTAANRDAHEFDNPTRFEIERKPNRHLSFGSGPHRCIGSHLARIELVVAMQEIHRRIPDYRLDPSDPPVWHPAQTRGVVKMPILFTPES